MKVKEAFDIFRKYQNELYTEQCMAYDLEESTNRQRVEQYHQTFFHSSRDSKHFYDQIFLMEIWNRHPEVQVIPFANSELFFETEVDIVVTEISSKLASLSISDTINELDNSLKTDQDLIDVITFSLLPSLYFFFSEEISFNNFCEFITKMQSHQESQSLDFHFQFARSIFLSPLVLKSLNSFFALILEPFYSDVFTFSDYNLLPETIPNLRKELLDSLKDNVSQLPIYLSIFFSKVCSGENACSPATYMKRCLFTPLLENPLLYQIVNSRLFETPQQLEGMKNFLKELFSDEFINEFTEIIVNNQFFDKSLLSPSDTGQLDSKAFFSRLTSHFILSTFDFYAIELILGKPEYTLLSKIKEGTGIFKFYRCTFLLPADDPNSHQFYASSAVIREDPDLPFVYLKRLIRSAPPMPSQCDNEDASLTPQEFLQLIKDHFVNIGNPFTNFENQIAYKTIEESIDKIKNSLKYPDKLEAKLQSVKTSHSEEKVAAKVISFLENRINRIQVKKETVFQHMKRLFLRVLTKFSEVQTDKIPATTQDAEKDPIHTVSRFRSYFIANRPNSFQYNYVSQNCHGILAQRFYKNLRFSDFKACRPELDYYDKKVESFYSNNLSEVIRISRQKHKHNIIFDNLRILDDYAQSINRIFSNNCDPATKLEQLIETLDPFFPWLKTDFSLEGEDDTKPVFDVFFAYANPPNLISNSIYLFEYLFCLNEDFSQPGSSKYAFHNIIIFSLMKRTTDFIFPEYDFLQYQLAKTGHKNVDISILGNNKEMTMNVYNQIIDLFDPKHETYQVLSPDKFKSKDILFQTTKSFTSFDKYNVCYNVVVRNLKLYVKQVPNEPPRDENCNGRIGIFTLKMSDLKEPTISGILMPFHNSNDYDFKVVISDAKSNTPNPILPKLRANFPNMIFLNPRQTLAFTLSQFLSKPPLSAKP